MKKKQFTPIIQEQISNSIKRIMAARGIKGNNLTNHLIDKGWNKQLIYTILKIGTNAKREYKITSLIKLLNELKIPFSEL